ncbi:hypothetical protein AADZ84_06065 [Colwelliaceae bacterium MEBiC 14330]
MKFKVASFILALFTLIGLVVITYSNFESDLSALISILLFVLLPAYGAYGTWVKSRMAILITVVFFIFQSVRNVGTDNLFPHIAPITISFPIGDFSNGQGYLIDFFAISMAIFLAWLLKVVITPNKALKSDS